MPMTIIDMMAGAAESIRAYGTSEGSSKGWDTRGRGKKNDHAEVMQKHGFVYRGKVPGSPNIHRYAATTPNPKYDSDEGFGKNLDHNIFVDQNTGKWAHEAGFARTNMATTRGHGNDAVSLNQYLREDKHTDHRRMGRVGPVWNQIR